MHLRRLEMKKLKSGKRPTKNQSIFIQSQGLDPKDWLIVKNESHQMVLIHRVTGDTKYILL
jgi:hypothetical protein